MRCRSREDLRCEKLGSKAGQDETVQDMDCNSYKKLSGINYYWVLGRKPWVDRFKGIELNPVIINIT